MTTTTPYLEENLQLDYNHLESRTCFCSNEKQIGELTCHRCFHALPEDERNRLSKMKPGEGLCSQLAIAHSQMWRKKKGWFG